MTSTCKFKDLFCTEWENEKKPSRSQTVFETSVNIFSFPYKNSCCAWKCKAADIIWHLKLADDWCIVEDFSCRVTPKSSVILVRMRVIGRIRTPLFLGVTATERIQIYFYFPQHLRVSLGRIISDSTYDFASSIPIFTSTALRSVVPWGQYKIESAESPWR